MKNIFNIFITIIIIYFSFYYTNKVSNYIKNKDPIMITIKNNRFKYYKKPINAIINNNTIIPGINGIDININKSYQKMKHVKSYQDSLLIFKEIKPNISLYNHKEKLIINGNQLNNKVSLLLKINDIDILNNFINNKNINFILTSKFIKENYYYLNNINNNIVINQDENIDDYINIINYCYTTNINLINNCLNYNKFSIFINIINSNYYYNTYKIIDNGSILSYQVGSYKNINEINLLINSINNLGYNIVSLDNLLKE